MKSPYASTQVYFDCNATTPVLPVAAEAALDTMRSLYGNPSSSHLVGLQAKFILENTRKTAARVIGAEPEQIIFTSGATEAIQTAIFSALLATQAHPQSDSFGGKKKLLYGATEHKAIPQTLHHWTKALSLPFEVIELPVDPMGQIRLDVLKRELPFAALVCTMAVNNETGVIQNLSTIEKILIESHSDALWLVDCVQALGKKDIQLSSSRIDYAPFSGHKLYAPKGIGFLYVKKNSPLTPLMVGGGQEKGLRSGTENLPGVAAFGAVLEKLLGPQESSLFHSHKCLVQFRERLVFELKRAFPKVEFNTPFDYSIPTTINFSVPGFSSGELLDLFDSAGLRLSAGSACNSGSINPSHVLDAMGIPLWRSTSALRLSFGPYTEEREIERGCQIIRECALALKNTCLLQTAGAFEAPESLRDGIIQLRTSSTNSWILAHRDSRTCVIIDPHETVAERIEHYVRCQNLKILAVLDTHSHGDHESIRQVLQKILYQQMISPAPGSYVTLGWPSPNLSILDHVRLESGLEVQAIRINASHEGNLVLARLETPGHTDDSLAFLVGKAKSGALKKEDVHFVFCGDTILSGGLGRTNFSISNPKDLFYSLRKIQENLNPSTLLCPAHDYSHSFATSLMTEIGENSLLALALNPLGASSPEMTQLTLESFVKRKVQIDTELAHMEESFQGVICGVTPSSKAPDVEKYTLATGNLQEFLISSQSPPWIIDVREPQEFSLFKDWKSAGFKDRPRNVPLSRFVNFMSELLTTQNFQQEVLLICRTGARSLLAAKALRRLGFSRVWILDGGVTLSCQESSS